MTIVGDNLETKYLPNKTPVCYWMGIMSPSTAHLHTWYQQDTKAGNCAPYCESGF